MSARAVFLLKSDVKGHVRKDGAYIGAYSNKVQKAPGKPAMPGGYHPKLNDAGKAVVIKEMSRPTPLANFHDANAIATTLPGSVAPELLNHIPLAPWHDAPTTLEGWAAVEGQAQVEEPEFVPVEGKTQGAGVIVQEPDGRVWVCHPTNAFGGYKSTFPKGTVEDGLNSQASAIKEAFEESGLKVQITGFFADVTRTTSVARYYTAKRVGGTPSEAGWESQSVSLVPVSRLYDVLNMPADHGLAEKLGAGPAPKVKVPKAHKQDDHQVQKKWIF